MTSRLITVSLAITLAVTAPSGIHAQQSTTPLAALTTDSTAWQRVLAYTVEHLSEQLLASAADPTPQPWQVQLPEDPQTPFMRAQLRTLLRMRQPMPADTIVRVLKFGPLVVAADTARVDVSFQETRKCPGVERTTGFGWNTTVLVARIPKMGFWGAGFSQRFLHGDRMGCPRANSRE